MSQGGFTHIRPPAVAGSFYPERPEVLRAAVAGFVRHAVTPSLDGPLRALVAPHAGYIYSGPVAGSAYALLAQATPQPKRVALLGPSHYVAFAGLALPESDGFETPLGVVRVDTGVVSALSELSQVNRWEKPHQREHSLEVHFPFLQCVLSDGFTVAPLAVGRATPADIAEVIETLWDLPGVVVVVSTDLSHYLPAAEAHRLDSRTAEFVVRKNFEALDPEMACGYYPLSGLLLAARRRGFSLALLELRNSADTAGDPDRVVGYGSFVVSETEPRAGAGASRGGRRNE